MGTADTGLLDAARHIAAHLRLKPGRIVVSGMEPQQLIGPSQTTGTLLRQFYAEFGLPGEGPDALFDLRRLESFPPVPASELEAVAWALKDQTLRRNHRECKELVDSILTDMASETLLEELSDGTEVTPTQFDRLTCGSLWYSTLAAVDVRDCRNLPVPFPAFAAADLPLQVRFQATVFGSLILRLYVALVFIREGDLLALTREAARMKKPAAGRIVKLLRSDYVRHLRNALAHSTFERMFVGVSFQDGDATILSTPGFLNQVATCISLAQLQAAAAATRRTPNLRSS